MSLNAAVYLALYGLMVLAMLASAVIWLRWLPALVKQGPRGFLDSLLPARSYPRPFWGAAEFLIMFGSMVLIGQLIVMAMVSKGWMQAPNPEEGGGSQSAGDLIATVTASSVAGLAGIAIVMAWMRVIEQDARRKFGLTIAMDDITLGLKASVVLLPPVLLISAAVSRLVPYEHAVLTSLAEFASPSVFAALFVGTAIVTPIVEEVMLRGLLQGGLQGFADRWEGTEGSTLSNTWSPRSHWPVFATSAVFALLHLGQGAAPVPLFVLSLGLGYLYRQTGSLAAPIVVHMVLNSMTLLAEFTKPV